jgi:hypothetical protein
MAADAMFVSQANDHQCLFGEAKTHFFQGLWLILKTRLHALE